MKKFILAVLAAASVTAVNAQKGSWLTYGTVGIHTDKMDWGSKTGKDRNFGWNINPGIGYQATKDWTFGVQGGYMREKSETTAPFTPTKNATMLNYQISDASAGIFARNTMDVGNIFALYHQLDISAVWGTYENADTLFGLEAGTFDPIFKHSTDDYMGWQIMLTPAIGIKVHDGMALNFAAGGIGYRMVNWNIAGTTIDPTESSFMFTWGTQINIGVSKNICGPHKHHHMEPGMEHRKMKKAEKDDDDDE